MNSTYIINSVTNSVHDARINLPFNRELFNRNVVAKNDFLFFIKPEITLNDPKIRLWDILKLIFDKLDSFEFIIKNVRIINAAYLEKHHIINQHYGVISQLSSDIRKYISDSAINTFEEVFSTHFNKANVMGSIEFLKKFSFFSPTALSLLWQNSKLEKLSSGTYCVKLSFDGEMLYLINGFHPRQLEHFYDSERCIVVMSLTSNTDWSVARKSVIGETNPELAEKGSIRNILLERKRELGLKNISRAWNGVHLSAGPVEGLIELIRYNSDFESGKTISVSNFQFGQKLTEYFGENKTRALLNNPTINLNGKRESIFDITEELNTENCLEVLQKTKELLV